MAGPTALFLRVWRFSPMIKDFKTRRAVGVPWRILEGRAAWKGQPFARPSRAASPSPTAMA
jgi:hypothetical protein